MLVGYARTSTKDQIAGLEQQKKDLLGLRVTRDDGQTPEQIDPEHLYCEHASATALLQDPEELAMARPELAKCLAFLRKGDTLVVTKPDRLARNLRYMLQIEEALTRRGIHLIVMSMGGFRLDTANPTNKLLMQILAGVAEWERAIMRERQRGGIDRARALRKYAGRKPISPEKTKKVLDGLELGMSKKQAAEYAGCGLTTVYRIVWGGHTPPVLPPAYPKSWEKDKRGYLKEFAVPTRPIPVEKLLGL